MTSDSQSGFLMQSRQNLVGIILAAGEGRRIRPLSAAIPKPLLPVCNVPLLCYQVELLKESGILDLYVVIGHNGNMIRETLGDGSNHGVCVRYIQQKKRLGIAHALGQLDTYIRGVSVMMLGDIYFQIDDLEPAIRDVLSGRASACLGTKIENDPNMIKRNFAIIESTPGRVSRVIEKPRSVSNSLKGCGVYVFNDYIFDAIRRTPRSAMRDEYEITHSIQILIEDGHTVTHRPIVHEDVNVTVPDDLLRVNSMELTRRGRRECMGQNVKVHPEAIIQHTVLGNDVDVVNPIRIRNSVVFAGARVHSFTDLDSVIIHGDLVIECGLEAAGTAPQDSNSPQVTANCLAI